MRRWRIRIRDKEGEIEIEIITNKEEGIKEIVRDMNKELEIIEIKLLGEEI